MTLEELLKELKDITGNNLDVVKTCDGRLIEVVDEQRYTCFVILDDMVYINRYKINELHPMSFEEYLEYVRELNED